MGTVGQLISNRCIMEEVRQHHCNLAVAFYDHKKVYAKVHHDWMIRKYEWIRIQRSVIRLIKELMKKWKTRLEIRSDREKMTSQWIQILCGFLQGDNYSPVRFCISEIPVCILLQHSCGRARQSYHEKNTQLACGQSKGVYTKKITMHQRISTRLLYKPATTPEPAIVSKCAKIIFEHGKMVEGKGLQVLEERMKTMDPNENEIYKFLGIEQADGIQTESV